MLVVEGRCDAFQPFRRRQWSTWLHGYRVVCINWNTAHKGDFDVVTGIAAGKYEGKTGHLTALLDAEHLKELSPMLACKRGVGSVPSSGIEPARLQTQMWMFDAGRERLEQVGIFVLCSGMQADAPMRSLLSRNLGVTAELGVTCVAFAVKGSGTMQASTWGTALPAKLKPDARKGGGWRPTPPGRLGTCQ